MTCCDLNYYIPAGPSELHRGPEFHKCLQIFFGHIDRYQLCFTYIFQEKTLNLTMHSQNLFLLRIKIKTYTDYKSNQTVNHFSIFNRNRVINYALLDVGKRI